MVQMYGSSVIALGSFNPAILSPDWLEHHSLIGAQDADMARQGANLLITHQVAQFEGPYFALQVLENQFSLTSKGAMTPLFKDLFVGIFTLLPQTPVTAVGLNFMGHYKLASLGDYHTIGDVLAPKTIWRNLFPGTEQAAGLANLTIRIDPMSRDSVVQRTKDHKHVTVQPSSTVKNGIFLSYNDHRDISQASNDTRLPAERVAEIVENDWDSSNAFAKDLFENLIVKALGSANAP
jgi:hypothetical protein